MRRASYVVALALATCTKIPSAFVCETDDQCANHGLARCETNGYCSVADTSCASGFRYNGDAASSSGLCVSDVKLDTFCDAHSNLDAVRIFPGVVSLRVGALDRVFVVGGIEPNADGINAHAPVANATLTYADLQDGKFAFPVGTIAAPPVVKSSVVILPVANVPNLFVIGGSDQTDTAQANVYRAPIVNGVPTVFQPAGALKAARRAAASVVVGNSVYVIGGVAATTPIPTARYCDEVVATVERGTVCESATCGAVSRGGLVFDNTDVHSLTMPRAYAQAINLGDRVCVVAGQETLPSGSTPCMTTAPATSTTIGFMDLNTIECADIQDDDTLGNFERIDQTLLRLRQYPIATHIGDRLYVIAGDELGTTGYNDIEYADFSPQKESPDGGALFSAFAVAENLPTTLSGGVGLTVGGAFYIFGGTNGTTGANGTPTVLRAAIIPSSATPTSQCPQ